MKKKLKPSVRRWLFILLGVLIAVGSVMSYVLWNEYSYRFSSAVLKSGDVKIFSDMTFEQAAAMLQKQGYITSAKKMTHTAIRYDKQVVHVGNYRLTRGESYRTLLTRLHAGNQSPIKITFNNIRTLEGLAKAVGKNTLASPEDFLDLFKKQAAAGNKANYINRFIPNTYEVYWTITPEEFTAKMLDEHEKFWDKGDRNDKAEQLGFTTDEVTTIASIVIEETKAEKEMSAVAGVYINRLKKKMPLQADPTVKFAIGDFSIKRIVNKHLQYDSPYNTYKNEGLPPGPICVPPIVAIDAVLNYADNEHNYIYFCANSDFSGTHAFASNLKEHNRNAAAYHRELNRRKIK